ncbi:MAG: molybdopterin-guanine dinucleotide biosynthesis protein B [Anaerolineae bacterium]|nr:molybdopterin-guanine dinucleotide biosynthesis protein B [Anaerolineae bacterium]
MPHANLAPILVVTGHSNSGKTTLIESLVPVLRRRGYRVGVIKHLGSDLEWDRKGKDTDRFWEAGADALGVLAPDRSLLMWRRTGAEPEPLAAQMDVDLVLAEGFKRSAHPAIVVTGGRPEVVAELGEGRPVVAVVGTAAAGVASAYAVGDVEGIADRVEEWLRNQPDAR